MIRGFALFCCFAFLFLKNGRYMQSNKIQEIFVIYAVVSYCLYNGVKTLAFRRNLYVNPITFKFRKK